MPTSVKTASWIFVILFLLTGGLIIYIDALPDAPLAKTLNLFISPIFGLHMAVWMVLGMLANYLWDLFRSGKTFSDIKLPELLLPLLVSPIIFYGIYSLWPDKKIAFALNLVAFQNGFFWQVVFSKAGPIGNGKQV